MKEKETLLKWLAAVVVGGISAYLRIMAIPLIILTGVMLIDYASGMLKAWVNSELSSKTGLKGIVKKVSYLLVICVAAVADWLITSGLETLGIHTEVDLCFGLIVTVWFIINECISILENLAVLGVPLPSFLATVICKLRSAVEKSSGIDSGGDDSRE